MYKKKCIKKKMYIEKKCYISQVVQTHVIPTREQLDPDVIKNMASLGCFKDRDRVTAALLAEA